VFHPILVVAGGGEATPRLLSMKLGYIITYFMFAARNMFLSQELGEPIKFADDPTNQSA
jgi:hypothetical protein